MSVGKDLLNTPELLELEIAWNWEIEIKEKLGLPSFCSVAEPGRMLTELLDAELDLAFALICKQQLSIAMFEISSYFQTKKLFWIKGVMFLASQEILV